MIIELSFIRDHQPPQSFSYRDATGDNAIIINCTLASHECVLYLHQLCLFFVLANMHFATLFLIRSVYVVISENVVGKNFRNYLCMCETAGRISNELSMNNDQFRGLGFSCILIKLCLETKIDVGAMHSRRERLRERKLTRRFVHKCESFTSASRDTYERLNVTLK